MMMCILPTRRIRLAQTANLAKTPVKMQIIIVKQVSLFILLSSMALIGAPTSLEGVVQ